MAAYRHDNLEVMIASVRAARRARKWMRPVDEHQSAWKDERDAQMELFRDIVGNPFLPVSFDRRWVTSDVHGIANGIYADRAFDRLPILADALMDAGCKDEQVISHCRSHGPHVRGS
jgi:hypothetical protein